MTILGSILMTMVGAGFLALGSVAPDELAVLGARSTSVVPLLGGVILVAAAAAIAFSIGVLRRRRRAMVGLLGLGGIYMFGCVLLVVYGLSGPQVIISILWIGVGSGLLWQNRSWFLGSD
ncbi:hypothetical protein [Ruania halotolerans]|uniref:hypothetical protein n=1 Tax=Ruania halotolerans TaxID=2897773 RepID=UPI001E2BC729|nr:hypothetical protein [Ruania halotolerans]UFU06813.1 hypothetical protein LQF10_01485 [Ruania halotolerans]